MQHADTTITEMEPRTRYVASAQPAPKQLPPLQSVKCNKRGLLLLFMLTCPDLLWRLKGTLKFHCAVA
jgi:hypothetical protein